MKNKYDLESLYVYQIKYNNSNTFLWKEGAKQKTFKDINLLGERLRVYVGVLSRIEKFSLT